MLERTLKGIPAAVDRIIVVDDASTDDTPCILQSASAEDERIEVVTHHRNRGVGAAIITGYEAFLKGAGDICVVMAGDDQMDPGDLPRLVAPLLDRRADYAKGNRLNRSDVREVMPRNRLLGNLVFTIITKWASGYWHVVDSQCGFTAISRLALERLDLKSVYPRYGFPNDLLIRLNVIGAEVEDVHVRAIYGEEVSGIQPFKTVPRICLLLIRGFFMRMWQRYVIREFHPLVLLYLFGGLLLFMGLGLGIQITLLKWTSGLVATPATVILCAICLIVGFQSTLFAMMFDMLHNQRRSGRRS